MSFPTLVYKSPGNHFGPNGSTYNYVGVNDQAELDARLKDGWCLTLLGAVNGEVEEAEDVEDESAPTREEMETMAAELGIKFDGRTTDAALSKKIDAALAEG